MPWSRIIGHRRLIEAFQAIAARGRLAHAYLFVGRPGIGKRLFAHELAKALLCEKAGAALEACGQCSACLLVDAGTHPDFFVVRRPEDKNEMPIELMRTLCANFGLKSARGKGKVAIVEDADDLNDESANCFLKTLEEPPPGSVFILVGTSPDNQLATILSRSHIVRFAPLGPQEMDEALRRGGVADAALRQRLAAAGQGSPGKALALGDVALWEFRRSFITEFSKPRLDVFGLSRTLIEFVEDAGKDAPLQRERARIVFDLILSAWTDALRLALGDAAVGADSAERAALEALAARAGPEKIMQMLERVLAAEEHIDRYLQVALALEGLVEACVRILEENPTAPPVSAGK